MTHCIDLPNLETISIGDGSFAYSEEFSISNTKQLVFLYIGNFCFHTVRKFWIIGQDHLQYLSIGNNSFTQQIDSYGNDTSKSFRIENCTMLISIEIGPYSFSDFGGEFTLFNLPALQIIVIGRINYISYNFYFSNFIIVSRLHSLNLT